MLGNPLISLAILKVNWDELQRDYVENFVPFVAEALRHQSTDEISLPDLQNVIEANFGIHIPLNPLRQLLRRAAKRGFVTLEHGTYSRNLTKCNELSFSDQQSKAVVVHDRVIEALQAYVLNRFELEWSKEEAQSELYAHLADQSLALLYQMAETGSPAASSSDHIIGSFITSQAREDPALLQDVELLCQGNLLLNAMYLPDPGKVVQRFKDTLVYIDTGLLVFAAGYAGPDRAAPVIELLDLLRTYGADVRCLQGTYEEMVGILDACAYRLKQGNLETAYGPSMEYFIQTGRTASDVDLMIARLPAKLRDLGVSIDDKPPYEREYVIDESGFQEALDAAIGYGNEKALIHDVDCIAAIARLRRGRVSFMPERSHALFVTTNFMLARTTRNYFQRDAPQGAVALCMTDYALGNLLWLKNPTQAPKLPMRQLLADAYAATQPPDHLWKRYLLEIAHLQEEGKVSPCLSKVVA